MTAQTLEHRCKARHGFWLAPGPGGGLYVYVPAGFDPADGAPLTAVRRATDVEEQLWREGSIEALAGFVRLAVPPTLRRHMPTAAAQPRRIGMADIWRRIRRRVFGGRG